MRRLNSVAHDLDPVTRLCESYAEPLDVEGGVRGRDLARVADERVDSAVEE